MIIVDGLIEDTDYPYIYCYAEDDEDTLNGMVPAKPRNPLLLGRTEGGGKRVADTLLLKQLSGTGSMHLEEHSHCFMHVMASNTFGQRLS